MALPTSQEERYYEQLRSQARETYRQRNQEGGAHPEVIFMGDSLTAFFPLEKLLSSPRQLANRGISASRTDHLLEHLDCHLFGSLVQQVVLLIGVNDLGYGFTLETIIANVKKLIEAIQAEYPFVQISLLELLPVNEAEIYRQTTGLRTNKDIRAVNQAYAQIAADMLMVDLVVTHRFFTDQAGQLAEIYTTDGLHLSPAGYELLASLIQDIL